MIRKLLTLWLLIFVLMPMVQITTNLSRYTSDVQAQTYIYESYNPLTWPPCVICGCSFNINGDCCCGGVLAIDQCRCPDCHMEYTCNEGHTCYNYCQAYCSNCNTFYDCNTGHSCNTYSGPCYCSICSTSYDCNYGHTCNTGGDGGGGSGTNPPPAPTYSPMGDPIDPVTGYPDVTARFNQDIQLAFEQFCGSAYPFGAQVDSYGNLIEGIFSYPQDYINYMENFINQVKGGAPWDLKAVGNGYSYSELGNNYKAKYNGKEYNFDDFGNITFGIAAAAYGFPIDFSKAGAGFYQILRGTSEWSYISSYFDAPRDQEMIEEGYSIFYNNGGCSGN